MGGTGRRRGWTRVAVGVLAVLAVAAGCSDDGPKEAAPSTTGDPKPSTQQQKAGPFPVLARSTTASGTLTASLPIAPGSVLIGPVFPDVQGAGGFDALLLVIGDPVFVYNSYIDSAGALGMRAGTGGGCLYGFGSITCSRRVIDPADGEALSVLVVRKAVEGGFISHAALRYQPPGSVDPSEAGTVQPTPPTQVPPPLALPAEVPFPKASDWSDVVAPNGPDLTLAEGTVLASQPGPCPCGSNGWAAVLRVDGPPEDAIAAYATQLGVDDPKIRKGKGEGDVRVVDLGLVPGGITQLRTVTVDDVTWMLFSVGLG